MKDSDYMFSFTGESGTHVPFKDDSRYRCAKECQGLLGLPETRRGLEQILLRASRRNQPAHNLIDPSFSIWGQLWPFIYNEVYNVSAPPPSPQ